MIVTGGSGWRCRARMLITTSAEWTLAPQRFQARRLDRWQSVAEHCGEDVDHLAIAIGSAGEFAADALQSGRQYPILEQCAVPERSGLACENRHVAPWVEHRLISAEAAAMIAHWPAILAQLLVRTVLPFHPTCTRTSRADHPVSARAVRSVIATVLTQRPPKPCSKRWFPVFWTGRRTLNGSVVPAGCRGRSVRCGRNSVEKHCLGVNSNLRQSGWLAGTGGFDPPRTFDAGMANGRCWRTVVIATPNHNRSV